ncbi:MAG: helix-turn-helix domain-containing protein [Micrococcales bacterium]|nr:helix-turn-helix domain-containing protein [Micrococcales bacterium]OJX67707.1 MAG: transcriptional regulator [Micrococcales bacterium 72-143]
MRTARIANPQMLGDILRSARLHSGQTQAELAEVLGMSQRYVMEIEAGKPTKAVERLFEYARETGVSLYADLPDA